ncbi:MAG: helix-turn-helix domain-containing protein, partial [Acidimicrobiales bacterium]
GDLDAAEAEAHEEEGSELSLDDGVRYARRGRGERGRPATGWRSLTPVEREIVGLVTKGCTNAEIAQRTFVSPNTVKKHLSSVYAKLGVDGRAELAAQSARREETYPTG